MGHNSRAYLKEPRGGCQGPALCWAPHVRLAELPIVKVQTRQAESPRGAAQLVTLQPREALRRLTPARAAAGTSRSQVKEGRAEVDEHVPCTLPRNRQTDTFGSSPLPGITGPKCSFERRELRLHSAGEGQASLSWSPR